MSNKRLLNQWPAFVLMLILGSSAMGSDDAPNPTQNTDGFRDTPMLPGGKWHVHDSDRPQPRVVTPGATFSHGAPAPSDAEMLFAGKRPFQVAEQPGTTGDLENGR